MCVRAGVRVLYVSLDIPQHYIYKNIHIVPHTHTNTSVQMELLVSREFGVASRCFSLYSLKLIASGNSCIYVLFQPDDDTARSPHNRWH